jgi:hypothetical protein
VDRYDLVERSEWFEETTISVEDLSAEHFDSEHIQCLAANVFCTHVDNTFQTKTCADSGCRNAMLTGSRLGNNALFSDPASEQDLANGIIDLV